MQREEIEITSNNSIISFICITTMKHEDWEKWCKKFNWYWSFVSCQMATTTRWRQQYSVMQLRIYFCFFFFGWKRSQQKILILIWQLSVWKKVLLLM